MSQLSNRRDPNAALRNRMHGGPPSNRSYGSESYRRYSGGGRGGYEPHKQHNNGVCERLDPKSVPKSKPTFPRTPERIPEAEYNDLFNKAIKVTDGPETPIPVQPGNEICRTVKRVRLGSHRRNETE